MSRPIPSASVARVVCLHTAQSNIALFDHAAAGRPLVLRHEVRPDLLLRAEEAGGMTPEIAAETDQLLRDLARSGDVDAVLLNCSTLGPAADGFARESALPVVRADAALAHRAVAGGGRVVVLCAVRTTLEATSRTFADAAAAVAATAPDVTIDVRLVDGAWALFRAGDLTGYLASIARAVDEAYDEGARVVALAQASMTAAATRLRDGRVALDSPGAAIEALVEAVATVQGRLAR